jgi:hypothetical protein
MTRDHAAEYLKKKLIADKLGLSVKKWERLPRAEKIEARKRLPTDADIIVNEEFAAMYNAGLQGRIEYSDTIRAKSYFDAIHEISKPSPWYDDDPIGDANSLYLKRLLAPVEIAADVIENSNDRQLIDTAKVGMVRSFFDYLPNTAKWWLNKRLAANDVASSGPAQAAKAEAASCCAKESG